MMIVPLPRDLPVSVRSILAHLEAEDVSQRLHNRTAGRIGTVLKEIQGEAEKGCVNNLWLIP
jgi:hypothetical protein